MSEDACELIFCNECEACVGCQCVDDGNCCETCGDTVCDECAVDVYAEDDPEESVGYICERHT